MRFDMTYFELGWRNSHSPTTTLNAVRFVIEYGTAVDTLRNPELAIEDYADHVGVSRSQAFRRQAAFRAAFPGHEVLDVWRLVKPALRKSSFRADSIRKQATFVASLHCGVER